MSAYKQFNDYLKNLSGQYNVGQDISSALKGGSAGLTRDQVQSIVHQDVMANTQYQRGVVDLKAAGLNPALMYGSSASPAPVASTPSSNIGSRFEMLMQSLQLPAILKQSFENIRATRAQIDKTKQETENLKTQNQLNEQNLTFLRNTEDARERSVTLSNNISEAQEASIRKNMDKMDKEMDLLVKQAATEEERKTLTYWQGRLAKANAEQVAALTPYEIEFKKAATAAQRAAAAASTIHAAYEKGLIDSGYIESLTSEVNARAHSAEQQAIAQEYVNALKTGQIQEFLTKCNNGDQVPVPDGIVASVMMITSMLGNTFGSIFK